MQKVLFVCLGNICRSPLAEGIFRKRVQDAGLADQFEMDSAGTASYHIGKAPSMGSQQMAIDHGASLDGQRARQVKASDFDEFDWLITMDQSNMNNLLRLSPTSANKIRLLLDFSEETQKEVHDPYFDNNYAMTYHQVETGCRGFLAFLKSQAS